MALTGRLSSAQLNIPINLNGILITTNTTAQLNYVIEITDDQLGTLGTRSYQMQDPNIIANVMAFVEQMVPIMEAQVGLPISIVTANTVVTANT